MLALTSPRSQWRAPRWSATDDARIRALVVMPVAAKRCLHRLFTPFDVAYFRFQQYCFAHGAHATRAARHLLLILRHYYSLIAISIIFLSHAIISSSLRFSFSLFSMLLIIFLLFSI
jgi:hypothetical protein